MAGDQQGFPSCHQLLITNFKDYSFFNDLTGLARAAFID